MGGEAYFMNCSLALGTLAFYFDVLLHYVYLSFAAKKKKIVCIV